MLKKDIDNLFDRIQKCCEDCDKAEIIDWEECKHIDWVALRHDLEKWSLGEPDY